MRDEEPGGWVGVWGEGGTMVTDRLGENGGEEEEERGKSLWGEEGRRRGGPVGVGGDAGRVEGRSYEC